MAYKKIGQYGVIGNGSTAALVGDDGAIDWLCLPFMDSPSVFAAILDDEKGGCFTVQPVETWDSVQNYLAQTNILQTLFRTSDAEVELLDFMPVWDGSEANPSAESLIVRRVRGRSGECRIRIKISPRLQYARQTPIWSRIGPQQWCAVGEEDTLYFSVSVPALELDNEELFLTLEAGQCVWVCLHNGDQGLPRAQDLEKYLEQTTEYWRQWVRVRETGKYPVQGFWQAGLDRAALVLKLLQFKHTGAIAAAISSSLPTIIYGVRNWDYRFSWIRDTSMTLQALFELGHTSEVSLYLDWLKNIMQSQNFSQLEVLYQLQKAEPPDQEKQLGHLKGYKGAQPVRIGQYSIVQQQHDIYGELLEMIFSLSHLVGKIEPQYWRHIRKLVDHVSEIWQRPDNGIWELRTGPHHVTHSKVMCWVALDRGIKIAEHYGFPADIRHWRQQRQAVHEEVLARGYNVARRTFTQHYDTEAVDAALLQIPLVGFLPIDDERVQNTIAAVEKELFDGSLPRRYNVDDGLPGQEHGWLICLFWYLRCLIRQQRYDEVEGYLQRVDRFANHLGLFGEEYDPVFAEITGNFPQAFSHIGYVTTVLEYINARRPKKEISPVSLVRKISFLFKQQDLTPPIGKEDQGAATDPGSRIKRSMNILRGQFYDGHRQRVDYSLIRDSQYYHDFLKAVASLPAFNPASLTSNAARIAFWVNVFNTLVIHGVIDSGIKESVKEVPLFFTRIAYRIGEHLYSLNDIEHGILRGNKVPPYRLRRPFSNSDPRLSFCVKKPDPRIHFALVCASRTCPPIEAYTEERLDEQLDTSAQVFINATCRLNKSENNLSVSKIFKWYKEDFPPAGPEMVRYLADYMYDKKKAERLRSQAANITIDYTPYDWRLNR